VPRGVLVRGTPSFFAMRLQGVQWLSGEIIQMGSAEQKSRKAARDAKRWKIAVFR
jgi:hypothetical protein